tara:strand:- start:301 stop:492 length:192 start_codon:yes stop_codon:yes gene_type:complete
MENIIYESLSDKLRAACPELTEDNFRAGGEVECQNDMDGKGTYIAKWDLDIPIPNGFTFGKPA